jgi:3-oxoadipate enol-lactonase
MKQRLLEVTSNEGAIGMAENTASATAGFIEVNGAQLYYEQAGQGQAMVLVHAAIADFRMWDDQFERFAQQYRVIRYDLRGFGRSTCPPGSFSHVGDLAGVLDGLKVDKAVLIGVSMGGETIVDFTLQYPQRVAALIPVGIGPSGYDYPPDEESEKESAMRAAYDQGDIARAADVTAQLWFDGLGRTPDQVNAAARRRMVEMITHLYQRPEVEAQAQRTAAPAIQRLHEIQVPTLVIVGDQDLQGIQGGAKVLAEGIAGAKQVVMADTAHFPNMEKPEEFNRLVLEFLREQGL